MREYFKELLRNLHTLTGYKQAEKLTQEQITKLLDELEKVCSRYGKIPEAVKKNVIDRGVLNDPDFIGLTPRQLNRWLSSYWENLDSATKFNLIRGEQKQEEPESLSPEEAQKFIEEWKRAVQRIDKTHLEPRSSRQVFKRLNEIEAVKVEQKIVPCPGYGQNECQGESCPKCMGAGKIKITL